MFKNRNLIAKTTSRITGVTRLLTLRAFAEEVKTEPTSDNNGGSNVDIAQLIAAARKEEKDKLYPRITELENKVKSLSSDVKEYLTRIANLTQELDEAKKNSDTKEKDTKISDLEKELADVKAQLEKAPNEESIRESVKAEYELKYYAEGLVRDNKDKLLSPYIPNITGGTKEEIDSALQKAIDDSTALKKELGIDPDEKGKGKKKKEEKDDDNKGGKRPPKQQHKSLDDSEEFEYSIEEIQNLDPASPEYAEFRKKIGLK